MPKLFFLPLLSATLLFSCGNPAKDGKTGTADYKGAADKGITVSNPLDNAPRAVKDSVFNGPDIVRYDNGVVYMRGEAEAGLRSGEWITFYRSGKMWSKGTYKVGYRQGYGISWWENGQKSSEGYYKDNQMIGKWTFWDEKGNSVVKDFGGQ